MAASIGGIVVRTMKHHLDVLLDPAETPTNKSDAVKSGKNERAYRAQVAALPVRHAADGRLEVLLITSRETRRWVIPKGWPMGDRKDHHAAAQEALEEAGISGRIRKRPLGAYTYQKRLVDRVHPCRVMVYVLDVDEERVTWPEHDQRTRQWFEPANAADNVDEPRLAAMIRSLGQVEGQSDDPSAAQCDTPPDTSQVV